MLLCRPNKFKSVYRLIFRVKSLKQLITLSFALVLIPLVALLWHSNSTLSNMAEKAASEPLFAVSLARNVHDLESLAVDLERATRQYQILKKIELQDLAQSYIERYQIGLESLCHNVQNQALCVENNQSLHHLTKVYLQDENQLNPALSHLRMSLVRLKNSVSEQLDARFLEQQLYIEKVKSKQVWFTVALITVSLILALFSSTKILMPVQKLEMLIKELADKKHELSDISHSGPVELVDLEHKLHQLAKRLHQLENLRKAMLRHAAHELKTPLASIKEGCSLLSEQMLGTLNERQTEVVSLLNSSSSRLENLVGQLLDYNMLLQQTQPNLSMMSCAKLMQEFMVDNQLAIQHQGHQVELSIDVDEVYGNDILFRRLLDNLLSNAIAYGTQNTPIKVSLYKKDNQQILEFANSGQALTEHEREVFFKPFQRGNQARSDRVSGSGLGLSIVAECAALMSGTVCFIDVEYADVCICFTITLPGGGLNET